MSDMPLLDILEARAARNRGIAQVIEHEYSWHARAVEDLIAYLRKAGPSMAEEWREDFLRRGNLEPGSSNAWGAVTRSAVAQGLIEPTGQFKQGKSVKNHAHPYRVWRVKNG